MAKYRMLILTDHSGHSVENSLYVLARTCYAHPNCKQLDIATRANPANNSFFKDWTSDTVAASPVDASFGFDEQGSAYERGLRRVSVYDYDVVWLRLPPPLSLGFLEYLAGSFPKQLFINDPRGIYETGSKAYLLNFPEQCPPMRRCQHIEDIVDFKRQFPIVLKPLRDYGGKGIVRIDGNRVWKGQKEITFQEFVEEQKGSALDYLGVKYLKNVSAGDKRIVVVNGAILGAALRLPAAGSWLCNVAMGGSSNPSEVSPEERAIIEAVHPKLAKLGIVMYGVDTLMDDTGRRVLSEINTTSIGGIAQIARQSELPLEEEAVKLIWNYIIEKKSEKHVIRH